MLVEAFLSRTKSFEREIKKTSFLSKEKENSITRKTYTQSSINNAKISLHKSTIKKKSAPKLNKRSFPFSNTSI